MKKNNGERAKEGIKDYERRKERRQNDTKKGRYQHKILKTIIKIPCCQDIRKVYIYI